MAENDDTEVAHNFKGQVTILALVLELGGGMMPDSGTYNTAVWSRLLGVGIRQVERYVDKYNIPYRKPGGEMYIDAADFRRHVPFFDSEQTQEE